VVEAVEVVAEDVVVAGVAVVKSRHLTR